MIRKISAAAASVILALVMVIYLPAMVLAGEYDIGDGVIQITATGTAENPGHNISINNTPVYEEDGQTPLNDPSPVITGTSNTNTVSINAPAGTTATVTLNNVNINAHNAGAAAVSTSGGDVTANGGTNADGIGGGYGGTGGTNIRVTGGGVQSASAGDFDVFTTQLNAQIESYIQKLQALIASGSQNILQAVMQAGFTLNLGNHTMLDARTCALLGQVLDAGVPVRIDFTHGGVSYRTTIPTDRKGSLTVLASDGICTIEELTAAFETKVL